MNASNKLKYLGVGTLALGSFLFLTPASFAQTSGADSDTGTAATQPNPGSGNATGVNPGTTNGTATVGQGQYGGNAPIPYVPAGRSGGGYGLWGLAGLIGLFGFLRGGRSYNPSYTRDELERRPLAR